MSPRHLPPPRPLPLPTPLAAPLQTLSPVPTPLPYLAHHPASLHIYATLLSHLPYSPSQLRLATHPTPPPRPSPPTSLILAVAATPARVPAHLLASLPDAARQQALISALGAFHSTFLALLPLPPSSSALSDVTLDSLPPREDDVLSLSSASSRSRTRRIAAPVRWRLAARTLRRAVRANHPRPLSPSRRLQDDLLGQLIGFVPRYLAHIRQPAARAAFVYALHAVLLTDHRHPALSTAVKNLVCYILARSAENPTLTAHSAYLANLFGATDRQLAACTHRPFLVALSASYRRRRVHDDASDSSTSSTASSSPRPARAKRPMSKVDCARKRMRLRAQLADQLGSAGPLDGEKKIPMIARVLSSPPKIKRSLSKRLRRKDDSRLYVGLEEGVLEDEDDFVEEPATISDILSTGETPYKLGLLRCQRGVEGLELEDGDEDAVKERLAARGLPGDCYQDSVADRSGEIAGQPYSVRGAFRNVEYDDFEGTEPSFSDLGDNPRVPDVPGLNSIEHAEEEDYDFYDDEEEDEDGIYDQYTHEYDTFDDAEESQQYRDDQSDMFSFDETLFTEKETAILLLAHDVARASRRNSAHMAKYPDAPPGPLITGVTASRIEALFKQDAIMEIVSVIAVFHMLQRWTVCFPYRAEGESLEAPVRKFVQTPIAHGLSVGSVGQRSASKSSASLRSRQGRSIRLPRHAVVGF